MLSEPHQLARNKTRVVMLTADAGFRAIDPLDLQREPADRAARHFRDGGRRGRQDRCRGRHRHRHRSRRQPRRGHAGVGAIDHPHRRLAAGRGGDAELRRAGGAYAVADESRGFPGQAGLAGRTGAHLRARGQTGGERDRPKRRSTLSLRRSAARARPRSRSRPRLLLLSSGQRGRATTCLVDLNFQQGACADYLDLEPRLDLKEIEPRPERLDRQLLEVMTSYHASGLAVIAAPNQPAEMRSFDPDMVTRLLDLVSSHFDHVVIDMPRTWFSVDRQRAARLQSAVHRERDDGAGPQACQAAGRGHPRAHERRPAAAGDRQPLRAAPVCARPEETATSSRRSARISPP